MAQTAWSALRSIRYSRIANVDWNCGSPKAPGSCRCIAVVPAWTTSATLCSNRHGAIDEFLGGARGRGARRCVRTSTWAGVGESTEPDRPRRVPVSRFEVRVPRGTGRTHTRGSNVLRCRTIAESHFRRRSATTRLALCRRTGARYRVRAYVQSRTKISTPRPRSVRTPGAGGCFTGWPCP